MKNPGKILLIVGSLNQGGAEFQLLSLAKLLQSKGFDIEVLALTDYDYFLPFVERNLIKYSCVPNEGNKLKRTLRAISLIRKKKPSLVISYIKRVSQVAILARVLLLFRFKLIISERTSLIKPIHDLFYFNIANIANRITVNSISKFNYINKRFFLLRRKTVFIPNIINLNRFIGIQKTAAIDQTLRFSYLGRISPEKNLQNLIAAVAEINNKGYKISLSLFGAANNESYFNNVQATIEKLELKDIVKYEGPTNDVIEVYKNTDALCLVSYFEGFSNVLSEALCSGIPIVASDIEENRFLVKDTVNGFLADPNDHKSIAGAIEKFIQLQPAAVNAMIEANNQKARMIFDEEKIYQSYLDLFEKIGFAKQQGKISTPS